MAFASSSFVSTKSDERKFYLHERSPFTSVSLTSLTYKATPRIRSLSKPKLRKETTIREGKILINVFLNKYFSLKVFLVLNIIQHIQVLAKQQYMGNVHHV